MLTLTILSLFVSVSSATYYGVPYDVELVNPGFEATQSRAELDPTKFRFVNNIKQMTVSFWMFPYDDSLHYAFSVVFPNNQQMGFAVNSSHCRLFIGVQVFYSKGNYVQPNEWNLVTFTWSSDTGAFNLYVDQKLRPTPGIGVIGKGFVFTTGTNPTLFTLGQSFGYSSDPPVPVVNARFTLVNFWDRYLSAAEFDNLSSCSCVPGGNVVYWEEANWRAYGNETGDVLVESTFDACTSLLDDVVNSFLNLGYILLLRLTNLMNAGQDLVVISVLEAIASLFASFISMQISFGVLNFLGSLDVGLESMAASAVGDVSGGGIVNGLLNLGLGR